MKDNGLLKIFTSQSASVSLRESVGNISVKSVSVKGLYGSSKSFAFACAVEDGATIVVMDNKEQAQFFTNDLYNLFTEDCVYFFPCSSNITSSIHKTKVSISFFGFYGIILQMPGW